MFNKFILAYSNDIQAFIPQLWAQESLMILEENMVAGQLVHRDFQNVIAQYGDTVNTRRPANFVANRKTPSDDVTIQDATASNVQVPLNQQLHVSFLIRDGEESKSFKDLVNEFLRPAMIAQARFIDQVVLGQTHQFYGASAGGHLAGLDAAHGRQFILETRQVLNQNKAPMDGRNLILTPNSETQLLNLDLFTAANQVGDEGTALREASLGRKLGFDMFMAQNTPSVSGSGIPVLLGAINHASGYAKGTTGVLAVDLFTGTATVGQWLTIVGDDTPYQITAVHSTLGNLDQVTLDKPLRRAVADDAVVSVVQSALTINNGPGYAGSTNNSAGAGWAKPIVVSSFGSVIPSPGQLVSFNTDVTNRYSIIRVDTVANTILLDRPLVSAIANADAVNFGPAGEYNLAFHRNAIALVVRPLAMPRPGTGAISAVVNYNGLSIRATITYQGVSQGHLVTLDLLCGVAVLDSNLGAVFLG